MKNYYGSLNDLEISAVSSKADIATLRPTTPEAIKRNLQLDELNENLFPLLVTGVSAWPFLTLAFDCETKTRKLDVIKVTKKLQKKPGISRIGPGTLGTVYYYKSMSDKIEAASKTEKKCKLLYKFLRTKRFTGDPKYFIRNEQVWKKLFKQANGKQAIAFISAYNDYSKSNDFKQKAYENPEVGVYGVVTQLLKESPKCYDEWLWRGAFSYAFLRCLYGVYFDGSTRVASYYTVKWSKQLLKILNKHPDNLPPTVQLPQYKQLLKSIKSDNKEPPLANEAKKAKKENKRILAGLRLGLFYNLYYKPTRRAIAENYS